MIPDKNGLILFRFSEQRWIDKLIEGEVSFSCAGAFIHEAKRTGNNVQGDEHEAVFARLKNNDPRIEKMRNQLGRDLEEIPDGDHTFLRRKSAKMKPIFCFYGYKAEDAIKDALKDGNVNREGIVHVKHEMDERLYSGFSDSLKAPKAVADNHRLTMLSIQPGPFIVRILEAMIKNHYNYVMRIVDYEKMKDAEFFIEPDENYSELFYKHPSYDYQYETRICMRDMRLETIFDRFSLNVFPLLKEDYDKQYERFYLTIVAGITKR